MTTMFAWTSQQFEEGYFIRAVSLLTTRWNQIFDPAALLNYVFSLVILIIHKEAWMCNKPNFSLKKVLTVFLERVFVRWCKMLLPQLTLSELKGVCTAHPGVVTVYTWMYHVHSKLISDAATLHYLFPHTKNGYDIVSCPRCRVKFRSLLFMWVTCACTTHGWVSREVSQDGDVVLRD